jgi:hypothetical protein
MSGRVWALLSYLAHSTDLDKTRSRLVATPMALVPWIPE